MSYYDAADPRFPYDRFIVGIVWPRAGTIERIFFSDLDHDGEAEVMVALRSVGTGSHLAADAFARNGATIRHVGSVSGLPKDADPVKALAAQLASRAEPHPAPGNGNKPRPDQDK